jgi:hypothetical protein
LLWVAGLAVLFACSLFNDATRLDRVWNEMIREMMEMEKDIIDKEKK